MKKVELLAPAGSFEKAKIAIMYGSDALYCGTPKLSLRSRSEVQDSDLEKIVKYAHERGVKVYPAINIYDWDENYEDIKGYCYSASLEEIRANDYSLVSGRYVGIDDSNEMSKEEVEEQIKIVANELKDLLKENQELAKKVEEILDM